MNQCYKRVYRTRHRHCDNIYASTPIHSVLRLHLTISLNNNWTVRTGDISVPFLHAAAATSDLCLYVSTNRVLQRVRRHHLEAQQGNLRFEEFIKGQANTPGRGFATASTATIRRRTQHLLQAGAQRLHPGLCGRSTSSWRRGNSQQDLQSNSATPTASTNRNTYGRKHSVLSRTQHHQQR